MIRLIILLFLIWLSGLESATTDDVIESCLLKILRKYFRNKPILVIADLTWQRQPLRGLLPNLEREYSRQVIGRIMEKKKWTLQLYNADKQIGIPASLRMNKFTESFFFIRWETVTSEELFQRRMDRLQGHPLWNPSGRTTVVVKSESNGNDSAEVARRVIEELWEKSRATDTLVLVAEKSGTVHFYTWFPYKQPDCSEVKRVVHLNTYRKGRFQQRVHLFPVKLGNDLEGCELIAGSHECPPYVLVDVEDDSSFVDGMEVQIFESLSRYMNFKLTVNKVAGIWATFSKKKPAGAFKLLLEQKIDLAFSCLMLDADRYQLTLSLPCYFEDALVWFVPSPTYRPHTVDIFYTFPVPFWLVMMVVMFTAVVVVVMLVYMEHRTGDWGTRIGDTILRLFGVSVYAPVGVTTNRYTIRLFVFVFFLYSMHITIAFQSSLFELYQQPKYHRFYTSLEEAVEDDLFFYLQRHTKGLYNQSDHHLWEKILRPKSHDFLEDIDDAFNHTAYGKSAITLYIKTTGIHRIYDYYRDEDGVPLILWLKESFAPFLVTTYLSPGSPLHPLFEKRIYDIMASGLITIWLSRILGDDLSWKSGGYANRPLTLTHMSGPFFLLLLLLCTAIVVFLCEVTAHYISEKLKKRRKPQHRHFYVPVKPKNLDPKLWAGQSFYD